MYIYLNVLNLGRVNMSIWHNIVLGYMTEYGKAQSVSLLVNLVCLLMINKSVSSHAVCNFQIILNPKCHTWKNNLKKKTLPHQKRLNDQKCPLAPMWRNADLFLENKSKRNSPNKPDKQPRSILLLILVQTDLFILIHKYQMVLPWHVA